MMIELSALALLCFAVAAVALWLEPRSSLLEVRGWRRLVDADDGGDRAS